MALRMPGGVGNIPDRTADLPCAAGFFGFERLRSQQAHLHRKTIDVTARPKPGIVSNFEQTSQRPSPKLYLYGVNYSFNCRIVSIRADQPIGDGTASDRPMARFPLDLLSR
jgi:hypothetical protein